MKKNIIFTISMVLISILLLSACGNKSNDSASSDGNGEVHEINFNISASPTSSFTKDIVEPWVDYVEDKSDGRIKVHVYTNAALGSLATGYEDIQNRVYELGMVSPGRHAETEIFPLTIGDLPFALTTPEVANMVLSKFIDEYMAEEDSFGNGTPLTIYATDAWNLYSKEPVETVADVKGKNISDSVPERLDLLKDWGASPVNLANTELYEGLERGTVDKVMYTSVGAQGFNLHEVSPYMTKLNVGGTVQLLLINSDFLNSLPEDLKTMFIEDFGPKFGELGVESYTTQAESAIKEFEEMVKDSGGKVIEPSEEAMEEFRSPAVDIAQDWVGKAKARGYDGEAMLEFYNEALEEAGVESPFK
ncbi:TRAP transporter substrate-binding protein [Pueribacillus sp. YX66]|uniref:TRAP transporter substrate-binding protein n=1 Tax=Pueribacillus sp. YX66 TaxID=3229242 RepID=UPI00358D5F7D